MKFKLIIFIAIITYAGLLADDKPAIAAAPIVSVVFVNESENIENVFTLVCQGEYFGNKRAGAYYPQFLPINSTLKRDTFSFDPFALVQGPGVYPFMFTYKGGLYYLVFATGQLLEKKIDSSFFATIVKVSGIQANQNAAQIDTIATLNFNQNDTVALGMNESRLQFYNLTNRTRAEFISQEEAKPTSGVVKLKPKTMPKSTQSRKVLLRPTTTPKPVTPIKAPVAPAKAPLLVPKTRPAKPL